MIVSGKVRYCSIIELAPLFDEDEDFTQAVDECQQDVLTVREIINLVQLNTELRTQVYDTSKSASNHYSLSSTKISLYDFFSSHATVWSSLGFAQVRI